MKDTLKAIATTAKTGSTCMADIAGIETLINVARDLTVSSGDALLVQRVGSEWYAIARTGTTAPPAQVVSPVAPPPSKPAITYGKLVVPASQTASYGTAYGWRSDNDDVYQGQYGGNGNYTGVWFYGTKALSIGSTSVTGCQIKLKRRSAGGAASAQALTFWLITQNKKPSGAPTRSSSTAGPSMRWGAYTTYTLPSSWGQALADGTAGGIGLYVGGGSPYVIMDGRSDYSASGTLTISWQRTN